MSKENEEQYSNVMPIDVLNIEVRFDDPMSRNAWAYFINKDKEFIKLKE
ncbi:MAG: hypothetical protein ACFFEN_05620 [Candidatus Thorarchaeota archaeon]